MNTIAPEALQDNTQGPQTPFAITLEENHLLVCEKLLRIVPQKRMVYQATWQTQTVIAKIFLDPIHAARHLKREAQGLNALQQAHVPAPKIIHQATLKNGIGLLITEYLDNALPLSSLLKKPDAKDISITILENFFKTIALLHQSGLAQNDLHLNNFLAKNETVYAIDGADLVKSESPLSPTTALKNLQWLFAQFNSELYPMLLEALNAYHRIYPHINMPTPSLLSGAESKRMQIWKKHAKKIFRNSTGVIAKKSFTRTLLCKRQHFTQPLKEFFNNPDAAIKNAVRLKDGHSSTVALIELANQKFVVKRFNIKNSVKLLRRQIPPSRCQKNWLNAHLLIFRNIPTAQPIALLEKRFGPFRFTGYVITEHLEGNNIQQSLDLAQNDPAIQSQILTRFTQTLKKLARYNISHGDFKATNFFDTHPTSAIIDLDAMTQHRTKTCAQRATQKDKARLLKNFTPNSPLHDLAETMLREE